MKRIQLFEFEDFDWFPHWLRGCLTRLITVLLKMLGVEQVLASIVGKTLRGHNISQIVDLGTGAGGAMPEVLKILREKEGMDHVKLRLSDLFPNPDSIKQINNNGDATIRYHENPVDATDLAAAPEGLKTMVNCFHHMNPQNARKILQSAYENKQPLLIYELAENKMPLILWVLMLPISIIVMVIMVLFMTPFVKPLTWQQLVFTYLIPIIPFLYAWDGQASMPRMYAFSDLDQMLEGLSSDDYHWEKGLAQSDKGKKVGTYLIGLPK